MEESTQSEKALVLGGGSTLAQYFKEIYPNNVVLVPKNICNITNPQEIKSLLAHSSAQYVINTAAITDMVQCETNPKECMHINAEAVSTLSALCLKYDKKLIHISSNYAVNPTNVYGESKRMSEKGVDPQFLIIRTSFFSEKTYAVKMLLSKKPVQAYKNLYFNPVSVVELVRSIWKYRTHKGLMNIFAQECVSYFEFASMICKALRLDPEEYCIPTLYEKGAEVLQRSQNACIDTDIPIALNDDIATFIQNTFHGLK